MDESLSLRETLAKILREYPDPDNIGKDEEYYETDSDEALQSLIKDDGEAAVKAVIEDADILTHDYSVKPSLGAATMCDIPYIPILLDRETPGTSRGIYVVYLFDPADRTLYLTLNQAGTEAQRTSGRNGVQPSQYDILTTHAEYYRELLPSLSGLEPTSATINQDLNRARAYNQGSILCKSYDLNELEALSDAEVRTNLCVGMQAYEALLNELYRTPTIDVEEHDVWTISPEGGDYWSEWIAHDIASLGHGEHEDFAGPDAVDISGYTESADEHQLYSFQFEITEGDIIVAGSKINKVDVVFGIGRVTDTYPTAPDDVEVLQEDTSLTHERFIGVDWEPIGPRGSLEDFAETSDGVGINCWKEGKRLFQRWTLHPFKADFGTFTGAIARRMLAAELADDDNAVVDALAARTETSVDTPHQPSPITPDTIIYGETTDESEQEDETSGDAEPETYAEWRANHQSVIDSNDELPEPDLLFDDQDPLSQIQAALENDKHVILTGPPGTGKTELARHVATEYVGGNHELVTATSDWTTFDTIGGYRPESDRDLRFHPGVFLDRLAAEDGTPSNEWLIIDELNRANIDKAFGSLFSALTGETVTLPFEAKNDQSVTLVGDGDQTGGPIAPHRYYIPEDWRLIATMNTYDKTSLYQMSFAFMRRFAFVPVGIPDDIRPALIQSYAEQWYDNSADETPVAEETAEMVAHAWRIINETRAVGPAIIKDILGHVRAQSTLDLTDPLIMYVLPQMEGLTGTKQRTLVSDLQDLNTDGHYVDVSEVAAFVGEYFGVDDIDPTDE